MRWLVVPILLALAASTASAERPGGYRPHVAASLSVGASIAWGVAANQGLFGDNEELLLGTMIVAPAAGRWYVGEVGIIGLTVRGTGLWLFANGIQGDGDTIPGLIGAGTLLMIGGALYDVFGSAHAAHRQNERRWAAMPTAIAAPGGSITPGLALGGSF